MLARQKEEEQMYCWLDPNLEHWLHEFDQETADVNNDDNDREDNNLCTLKQMIMFSIGLRMLIANTKPFICIVVSWASLSLHQFNIPSCPCV